MNEELFKLCNDVYGRTGWADTLSVKDESGFARARTFRNIKFDDEVPLYTSDYLLEKLPAEVLGDDDWGDHPSGNLGLWKNGQHFTAGYIDDDNGFVLVKVIKEDDEYYNELEAQADTSLKALLKLTMSLHEAGRLKAGDA